jgi:hypothetical protein
MKKCSSTSSKLWFLFSVKSELLRLVDGLTVSEERVNYTAGLQAAASLLTASPPLSSPPQETV